MAMELSSLAVQNIIIIFLQLSSYLQHVPAGSQSHILSASITREIHTYCWGAISELCKRKKIPIFSAAKCLWD